EEQPVGAVAGRAGVSLEEEGKHRLPRLRRLLPDRAQLPRTDRRPGELVHVEAAERVRLRREIEPGRSRGEKRVLAILLGPNAGGEVVGDRGGQKRAVRRSVGGQRRERVEAGGLAHDLVLGHPGSIDLDRGSEERSPVDRPDREAPDTSGVLASYVNPKRLVLGE